MIYDIGNFQVLFAFQDCTIMYLYFSDYPSPRGPVCFSCPVYSKNSPCNDIEFCANDEVCEVIYRTKVKTLHFCFWSKWPKKAVFFLFQFQFLFCKIKCLKSSYHLHCTCVSSKWKPKNEIFMCDFTLFLKNKIRELFFYLDSMCSVFTFFHYRLLLYQRSKG